MISCLSQAHDSPSFSHTQLELKESWKRKRGEKERAGKVRLSLRIKLVRAQRRVRRKPLARRGIGQPGSDAHEGESHAEGGPGGGRDPGTLLAPPPMSTNLSTEA